MPRVKRLRPDEVNLTTRRALSLLLRLTAALGGTNEDALRFAAREVKEALEYHVRFGLRSKRR